METISSLLARALGSSRRADSGTEPSGLETLPESLQKLASAINKDSAAREKSSGDAKASEKRMGQANELQARFNDSLKELADVAAILNDTQADALKQAEKRAKRDEERHKRDEASRKRAEKISAVKTRQNAAKTEMGVGLLGALFGKGIGDFAANAIKAQETTKSDIAEMASAIYEDRIATAEERKAATFEGIESGREAAVVKAASDYKATAETQAASLGDAVQAAKESGAVLARTEAAKTALDTAKAERRRIEAEGSARIAAASSPKASVAEAPVPAVPAERAPEPQPIIISPSGENAAANAEVERVRSEVAASNLAADAKVAEASDAFAKAVKAEGAAPAKYAGAVIQGESAIAAIDSASSAMADAIKAAISKEGAEKAEAAETATREKNLAYEAKATGTLVPAPAQQAIGAANLLTTAIAPPAVTAIAKVMDQFRNLFPVIGQAGSAVTELGTAIPATLFTVTGQLTAKILYGLSSIRDAISTPDVRKRYDRSDAMFKESSFKKSRAELYAEAEERNVAAYRKEAKTPEMTISSTGLAIATRAPAKANVPHAYTVERIPGTMAGTAHVATTASDIRQPQQMQPQPQATQERPLGVIPVGPSNGNVDNWRH